MPSGTGSHPGNSVSPDRRGSVEVASLDQNVKDAAFGINDASVVVRESLDDNAVIELRQEESAVTLGRRSRQSDRGVRAAGGEARESADAAVRRSAASASERCLHVPACEPRFSAAPKSRTQTIGAIYSTSDQARRAG